MSQGSHSPPSASERFHGTRWDKLAYVGEMVLFAAIAGLIGVDQQTPNGLRAFAAGYVAAELYVAWRGLRAGTVEATDVEARIHGFVRSWRFRWDDVARFESRLMPLPFLVSPHVVLVVHRRDGKAVVVRAVNGGTRGKPSGGTWVDAMVKQLNARLD